MKTRRSFIKESALAGVGGLLLPGLSKTGLLLFKCFI
ncbi:MAG TPA: hypothetical protein DIC22_05740 [Chitinophagaceae bacterium]|nr:hypothetical protein [Chitinophagaceae bacterium]